MIRDYLKITVRILRRHKGFSILNIAGLSLGMSVCLMIIIFIKDQKSSDRFNENRDRIVRIYTTDNEIRFPDVRGYASTPGLLAPYLLDNYPMIENAVRFRQTGGNVIHKGEAISVRGLYTESSFFNIFSYQLREGNPQTALNDPYSVILSEETALKFFGNEDPLNKTLTFEESGDFTVTGVIKDPGSKSHFRFDALFSFPTVVSLEKSGVFKTSVNDWSSFENYYTYVLLRKKGNLALLEEQLPEIAGSVFPEPQNDRFGFKLQPLLDINLGINLWLSLPGTLKSFDIIFIPLIAILIMFLICFNYITLFIAHSLRRTKETGFHKVIGARRIQIISLFLCETFVITAIALLVAILMIICLIPAFNGLDVIESSKLQVNIQQMKNPGLYFIFMFFAFGVAILAGLIPALFLSSFQPVNALQGVSRIKGLSHLILRKILMGVQFGVSLAFIIFIIYAKQLHSYLRTMDYGIETENLVNVSLKDINYDVFRNEVSANGDITRVSSSSEIPVLGGLGGLRFRSEQMEKPADIFYYSVDPEFIENFNVELFAGRNFSDEMPTDKISAIIINQEAVKNFGLGSPAQAIGKTLIADNDMEFTVIGVVKNFIYSYPDEPITSLGLLYRPEEFGFVNIWYVPGKKEAIKSYLQNAWKKFDKAHEVSYEFFDDAWEDSNREMRGIIDIFTWACGFVIIIALFGLLGMAGYTAEMRTKEISIRKVQGAGIFKVLYLLSKDFIKLILYSSVIAIPAGYFLSESFYQVFAFRPGLGIWVLPASLIFIIVLALITICSRTIKTALVNPAETLKEQ